jgi:hypothetical protein
MRAKWCELLRFVRTRQPYLYPHLADDYAILTMNHVFVRLTVRSDAPTHDNKQVRVDRLFGPLFGFVAGRREVQVAR